MPKYLWDHKLSGETREITRSMADSMVPPDDSGMWERNYATRIAVCVSHAQPETQAQRMMKGYHRLECEQGSRFSPSKDLGGATGIANTWKRARQAEEAGLRQTQQDSELPKDHKFMAPPQETPDTSNLVTP